MNVQLPKAIADYFESDRSGNALATSQRFTADAVVIDEGNRYIGRDAIRRWMANASTQYSYTAEPLGISEAGGRTVVTSRLTGSFPGSPVDLRYSFVLDGDMIAGLEIAP